MPERNEIVEDLLDLANRVDDAISWIDEPDGLTPEQQLAKIREALDSGERRPSKPVVVEFCAERAEYIAAINNCAPSNDRDYWRWNGHAEARRQLAERLGLPVAWPEKEPARAARETTVAEQPSGEAAYWLEGDDEIFTDVRPDDAKQAFTDAKGDPEEDARLDAEYAAAAAEADDAVEFAALFDPDDHKDLDDESECDDDGYEDDGGEL